MAKETEASTYILTRCLQLHSCFSSNMAPKRFTNFTQILYRNSFWDQCRVRALPAFKNWRYSDKNHDLIRETPQVREGGRGIALWHRHHSHLGNLKISSFEAAAGGVAFLSYLLQHTFVRVIFENIPRKSRRMMFGWSNLNSGQLL